MTVIYGNRGDMDTLMLPSIWERLDNVNVVEIGLRTFHFEDRVAEAIANEDDTLILCGHGTSWGLLHPNFHTGQYIIHENNYRDIHARNLICVWCHAADFAERYHVNGFFSSMFISNVNEAQEHLGNGTDLTQDQIGDSELIFCRRLNALLRDGTPLNEWVPTLKSLMNENNMVERYNYNGLKFFENYE